MQVNGAKIRELRESLGLTQKKFAKAVGITQSFLSLVETGYCNNMANSVVMLIDIKFGANELAHQIIEPVEAVEIEINDIYEGENVYRDIPIPKRSK